MTFRILEIFLEMFKVHVGLNYQLLPEYLATTVNLKRDLLKNKAKNKGSFCSPIRCYLTFRLRARVFYEQIVNDAQPSPLSPVENEGE